jgi:ATP-binding cassette subfamily C (CFTR/MRP) protein 1
LQWLGGFIALICISIIAFGFDFVTLAYTALVRAGNSLHTAELKGVFGTILSFFEDNASGRIVNRFSQDLFVLDWEIVLALGNFVSAVSVLFGSVSSEML